MATSRPGSPTLHRTFGGEANLAILTRDGVPHHYAGNPENPVFTFRLDGIGIASTVHLLHRSLGVPVRRERRHKPQARASEHHGHAGPNGTTRHRPSRAARQRLTRRARGRGRRRMTRHRRDARGRRPRTSGPARPPCSRSRSWSGSRSTGWASRRSTPRWACSSRTASSSTTSCPRTTSGRRCSWSASGGSIVGIIVQPTVGYISDFTVSRWGRRKPYIVFGSLLDVVFLLGIATANTVARAGRVRDPAQRSARTSPAGRSRATCRTSSRSRRSASPAASSG